MNELKYSKKKQIQDNTISAQEYKAIYSDEETLQGQCENLLNLMKIEYYRIPDATWSNKVPAYIRKILSKYLKGKPDLLVMKPYDDIYIKAVAFELKVEKGVLTGGQNKFQRHLPLIIIRSFEQFEKELKKFLKD